MAESSPCPMGEMIDQISGRKFVEPLVEGLVPTDTDLLFFESGKLLGQDRQ